jgi:hypothetical protein
MEVEKKQKHIDGNNQLKPHPDHQEGLHKHPDEPKEHHQNEKD